MPALHASIYAIIQPSSTWAVNSKYRTTPTPLFCNSRSANPLQRPPPAPASTSASIPAPTSAGCFLPFRCGLHLHQLINRTSNHGRSAQLRSPVVGLRWLARPCKVASTRPEPRHISFFSWPGSLQTQHERRNREQDSKAEIALPRRRGNPDPPTWAT